MFYQTFFSPQVKRCSIITYQHGIYVFPHELPNNLFCAANNRKRKPIAFCPMENRQGLISIRFQQSLNPLRKV